MNAIDTWQKGAVDVEGEKAFCLVMSIVIQNHKQTNVTIDSQPLHWCSSSTTSRKVHARNGRESIVGEQIIMMHAAHFLLLHRPVLYSTPFAELFFLLRLGWCFGRGWGGEDDSRRAEKRWKFIWIFYMDDNVSLDLASFLKFILLASFPRWMDLEMGEGKRAEKILSWDNKKCE